MSSSPKQPSAAPAQAAPPPGVDLQTTGWGNMGAQLPTDPSTMGTAATGVGTGAPGWASGNWAMPWWGQQAPNTGAAMLQAQNPAAYTNGLQPAAMQGQQAPPPWMGQQAPPPWMGQQQPQNPYLADRNWTNSIGRQIGVDPYGTDQTPWSPRALSAEDQAWLNQRMGVGGGQGMMGGAYRQPGQYGQYPPQPGQYNPYPNLRNDRQPM